MPSKDQKAFILTDPNEKIVIAGISGTFPSSKNVAELQYNLYNKVDMVASEIKPLHPDIPKRCGRLPDVKKFDEGFFDIPEAEVHRMDPALRIILEKSYEATLDAGMNPKELEGPRTGVYIGASFSETEKGWFFSKNQCDGYGVLGCSRAMLANRISYWMNATGPSSNLDTACSSALFAVHAAYQDLLKDRIDYAIVGGSQLVLSDITTLQFYRLGVLSKEGVCRAFDDNTNGYVRAETVGCLILTRAKNARRIYTYLDHVKVNCDGYKPQGITYPSGQKQKMLLEEFYKECQVAPESLNYVECHGTGTRVGDVEEANTVDEVFCTNRKTPLKIGSVKSNLGHAEPASGLCSIAKGILVFETGLIPPNLNYVSPRKEIHGLIAGRMQVVTEVEKLEGDLIGLSGFGFGGANCHLLMRRNPKLKIDNGTPRDELPRLVTFSGRSYECMKSFINELESKPLDAELVALYHQIFRYDIPKNHNRGYILLEKTNDKPKILDQNNHYDDSRNPKVSYVFSGLGSQWSGMGVNLLRLPIFAASIQKLQKYLDAFDVDLIKILEHSKLDNVLHSILGLVSVQIGLVDVMNALGVEPDFIVGQSVGELAAAYADGSLSAEQAILSAYYIGLVLLESKTSNGAMAVCYYNYDKFIKLCPSDIDIVGSFSENSCLVSGPADSVRTLLTDLSNKSISCLQLHTSNIAFNSRYVHSLDLKLRKLLEKIIPDPKKRSTKYIPVTSNNNIYEIGQTRQVCSASYLSSCVFRNDVDFNQSFKSSNLIIEISPSPFISTILSIKKSVYVTSLVEHDPDAFFTNLGNLFIQGLSLDLAKLYPPVQFPVSRGTAPISSVIKWNHHKDYFVTTDAEDVERASGENTYMINIKDPKYESMAGHVIDGRNLFPATGYLVLAWETLAIMHDTLIENFPVIFEDVQFLRATNIPSSGSFEMTVMIQRGTGHFEIEEGGSTIVCGTIRRADINHPELLDLEPIVPTVDDERLPLTNRDIYKELRLRGYNYKDDFRAIIECDNSARVAEIEWKVQGWVAFMDNMLQMQILQEEYRFLYVPTSIQRLVIYPHLHLKGVKQLTEKESITVTYHKEHNIIKGGGVEIRGLEASSINRRKPLGEPVYEQQCFVPFLSTQRYSENDALRIILQTALELSPAIKVKLVEVDLGRNLLSTTAVKVLGDLPLIQPEVVVLSNRQFENLPKNIVASSKPLSSEGNAGFVIDFGLINDANKLAAAAKVLRSPQGFIISRENPAVKPNEPDNYDVIIELFTKDEKLVLLRKKKMQIGVPQVVNVSHSDTKFTWLSQVQSALKKKSHVILYCQNEPVNGLIGLVNCMIKESYGEYVRCIFIDDSTAPKFDIANEFYNQQLKKGLYINIYRNGSWGALRHLELSQTEVETDHAFACVLTRGDLSSIRWTELPRNPTAQVIDIYYSAFNFRDVMTASGKLGIDFITRRMEQEAVRLPPDCCQGLEFCGRDSRTGKRYMGLRGRGAIATKVYSDPILTWEVPDHWTMEEAVTVPVVYATVYYSLVTHGMRKGDTVLIHSGTGGVGLAAINVALHYGCEVFTTVGTQEKREFIKKTFPQIKDTHIGNSRDTSFEEMITIQTNGKGVNFVLNSLAEEKLIASVRCLSENGKFLEIGKFDLSKNTKLGMEVFMRGATFSGIMLDNAMYASDDEKLWLKKLVQDGIAEGAIKPLPRTIFQITDALEKPFRYMASGKHLGKVLLKIRDEEPASVVSPSLKTLKALPRVYCPGVKTYIIIGGLGGFGLELSNWLMERGCKNLVLSSRYGLKKGYQSICVQKWKNSGINVQISTANISTRAGVTEILTQANKMGPVGGIFNLSVVLSDAIIENQTPEKFETSFLGKALGTQYLDEMSRKICPELEYFVVFSSVSCGRGNAGQSNYGMANSVMERICEKRKAEGYPALAIQWGAIGDVGIVADLQDNDTLLEIGGTLQQSLNSCLESMDVLMKQDAPVVASMVVAEKKYGFGAGGNLVETILSIVGVRDIKTVSKNSNLAELGMDSMMAVEVKQTLEREYEILLTAQDIRNLTLTKLIELQTSNDASSEVPEDSTQSSAPVPSQVGQSDESVSGVFKMLVRVLGSDQEEKESMTELPSLATDLTTPVFLFPGIEGQSSVFETLCKDLKQVTYGLRVNFTSNINRIETLVDEFLQQILKVLKPHQPYNLIGYSFGGLVATEVATKLEKLGHKGKILYLDGGPGLLKRIKDVQLKFPVGTPATLIETKILLMVMTVITNENLSSLEPELLLYNDWTSRLEFAFGRIPRQLQENFPAGRQIITGIMLRFASLIKYQFQENYNVEGAVALIRPTIPVFQHIQEDYNLSIQVCAQNVPVPVTYVEGDHHTFISNSKLAKLINEFFVPDA